MVGARMHRPHRRRASWSSATRERWILAEDEPDIVGYDQALWVDRLEHNADDPASSSSTVRGAPPLRTSTSGRVARPRIVSRVGRHRERGDESYGLTFRLAAGHDRVHLAQARRALETVTRSGAR